MDLLAQHNLPFAVALALMAMLALVQMIGLDFGGEADADYDADGLPDGGIGAAAASLLGLGRVPLTVWLALFLLVFAAVGVSGQALADNLTGAPLDRWLAALLAAGASLPLTGALVRPLASILPQDETTAVPLDALVGKRAEVLIGTARSGSPARARVHDRHGHPHLVMVEPHEQGAELAQSEIVLLVRREGELFFAAQLETPRLAPVT